MGCLLFSVFVFFGEGANVMLPGQLCKPTQEKLTRYPACLVCECVA